MRIPRIFCDSELNASTETELDSGASHHLIKVLRSKVGHSIILFNGSGSEYPATITALGKKIATVRIDQKQDICRESPIRTELAIGLSRGERMDWVIQKATELGVTSIVPLFSERTEVKLTGDRLEKRISHWRQISISACEQCQRNRIPSIEAPISFDRYLTNVNAEHKYVLHHRTEKQLDPKQSPNSIALLIGPEGGLSDIEIQQAESKGFNALSLGPRVFRTETAPIAALSVIQYLWGDF